MKALKAIIVWIMYFSVLLFCFKTIEENPGIIVIGIVILGIVILLFSLIPKIEVIIKHKKWLKREEPMLRHVEGYPEDWDKRRKEVFIRAKGICGVCGRKIGRLRESTFLVHAHVHHIKPISQGGDHSFENLMLLCEGCHITQHPGINFENLLKINRNIRKLYIGNRARLKKSRASWKCHLCESPINPGDMYYGGNYDKLCERCYVRRSKK